MEKQTQWITRPDSRLRSVGLTLGIGVVTAAGLLLSGPLHDSQSVFAAILVLLHLGLGLLLVLPVAVALLRAWRQRRRDLLAIIGLAATGCAGTGLWLAGRAVAGFSIAPQQFAWITHLVSGFAALCAFGFWRRFGTMPKEEKKPAASIAVWILAAAMLIGALALFIVGPLLTGKSERDRYDSETYYRDLTATNGRQAQNTLFPAGFRLPDGANASAIVRHWNAQPAAYCGRSGCHVQDYQNWRPSAHSFGGADPFYQRVAADYVVQNGPEAVRWCAGCHDPKSAFGVGYSVFGTYPQAGSEDTEATASLNSKTGVSSLENRRPNTQHRTPNTGVDCIACHTIAGTGNRVGNGTYQLDVPPPAAFAENETGWPRRLHDFLLRVRPYPHTQAFAKPELHRSSEFCAACHRQSFGPAQNHYQFVSGPDTFGEWQGSPQSGRWARAFQPGSNQSCQGCHMARQSGGHIVHGSPGANTILPTLRGDTAFQARTEAFLRQSGVTLDLFALRTTPAAPRTNSGVPSAETEEWTPLDASSTTRLPRPGDDLTLDVVVSNRNNGHAFPSGYDDIQDAWLEITVVDAQGRVVLQNGHLDHPGDTLPPDVHAYRSIGLDRNGKPTLRHNLTEQVTTVYHRTVSPAASDLARYRFRLPSRTGSGAQTVTPFTVRARLLYRPLRPDFAEWAAPGSAARLPVTVITESACLIPGGKIGDRRQEAGENEKAGNGAPSNQSRIPNTEHRTPNWQRWLGYGNALLAPAESPDFAGALRAYGEAQRLAPNDAEPLWRLGQAYLRESSLAEARSRLEAGLRIQPKNAAIRADLALVYTRQGQYERALALQRTLAHEFPLDTNLQYEFGTTLKRMGRFQEATEAFQQSLTADPNNSSAHFLLQQCLYVLRQYADARREEAITRYMGEDTLRSRLLPDFLRRRPDVQAASQPFPQHRLTPPAGQ